MQDVEKNEREDQRKIADMLASWMAFKSRFRIHRPERHRLTQSDALRDQLLQECLVKLRDVQGTAAPKQYACNLIKRIERVLHGQSK
jgi:hypothetical protein